MNETLTIQIQQNMNETLNELKKRHEQEKNPLQKFYNNQHYKWDLLIG